MNMSTKERGRLLLGRRGRGRPHGRRCGPGTSALEKPLRVRCVKGTGARGRRRARGRLRYMHPVASGVCVCVRLGLGGSVAVHQSAGSAPAGAQRASAPVAREVVVGD